jgi:hypothetical protein
MRKKFKNFRMSNRIKNLPGMEGFYFPETFAFDGGILRPEDRRPSERRKAKPAFLRVSQFSIMQTLKETPEARAVCAKREGA